MKNNIGTYLQQCNLLKLFQEEIENITTCYIYSFTKEIPDPNDLGVNFYLTSKNR